MKEPSSRSCWEPRHRFPNDLTESNNRSMWSQSSRIRRSWPATRNFTPRFRRPTQTDFKCLCQHRGRRKAKIAILKRFPTTFGKNSHSKRKSRTLLSMKTLPSLWCKAKMWERRLSKSLNSTCDFTQRKYHRNCNTFLTTQTIRTTSISTTKFKVCVWLPGNAKNSLRKSAKSNKQ